MSHIILVRHGQANSDARNEADYDQLSPLGHEQAAWLGGYFRTAGDRFAQVVTGTLRRQIETADGIEPHCAQPPVRDARLNEMQYFTMAQQLFAQHAVPVPETREAFSAHMPLLFEHWQNGQIEDIPETFQAFETRVNDVMRELVSGQGRALVVTSGGVIAMAMRILWGLDTHRMAMCCLAIENSSVHRFQKMAGQLAVTQFNSVPHLDSPQRQVSRSHL